MELIEVDLQSGWHCENCFLPRFDEPSGEWMICKQRHGNAYMQAVRAWDSVRREG